MFQSGVELPAYYFALELAGLFRFFSIDFSAGTSAPKLLELHANGDAPTVCSKDTSKPPTIQEVARFRYTLSLAANNLEAREALGHLLAVGCWLQAHRNGVEPAGCEVVSQVSPLQLLEHSTPSRLRKPRKTSTLTRQYQWGPLPLMFERLYSTWTVTLGATRLPAIIGQEQDLSEVHDAFCRGLGTVSMSDPLLQELEAAVLVDTFEAVRAGL